MDRVSSPLHSLLNEINRAASSGFPLIAVFSTLALPDICVSLISPDGRSDAARYRQWCTDNLGVEFDYVTADDLYSMRCGVLHNGRFGNLKHNVSRIIFSLPKSGVFVNGSLNDAYFYSVVEFCANFTNSARKWFEANLEDNTLKSNLPRLMQYRENGFPPYIGGATVLA